MPKAALKLSNKPAGAVIDIAPAANPIAARWAKARRFIEAATLFQRASLAGQIMAGLELSELHRIYESQGKRSDLTSFHGETKFTWEQALEKEVGISRTTAWRWMEMGRAARPRLAKSDLELGAILEKNPGALTAAEQELLKKAVHKISDGKTQLEFMLEAGVTKAAQGSAAKGGKLTPTTGSTSTAPLTVQQTADAALITARAWYQAEIFLLKENFVKQRSYRHLPDTATADGELTLGQFKQLLVDTLAGVEAEEANRNAQA
jgi:hypothetical protein